MVFAIIKLSELKYNHNLMKRTFLTTCMLAICFYLVNTSQLFSQQDVINNPAYGPDSASRIECANELSNLSEYMKINQPEYALISWRNVYKNCPASSKNIYILGSRIFSQKIDETKDLTRKAAYFDTLMMLYDDRIKYFGEEGYVLGRKGKDILKYHGDQYHKTYKMFKRSVELDKTEADVNVVVAFMETGLAVYKDDSISAKELLNDYLISYDALNSKPAAGSKKAMVESCNSRINNVIKMANLKDCSVIEEAFMNKIKQEPQNLSLLNVALSLMDNSGCENSNFYGYLLEKSLEVNNSAENSYNLAKYHIKKEKYKEAMAQLENAVATETDPDDKAQYYYQMAVISNTKLNNPQSAITYAENAIKIKPDWGDPYFQIAIGYIEVMRNCSNDQFIRSTVYWVAADVCVKAKIADPSVKEKANELISEYSKFFPNKEDLFFRSISTGSDYSVGCGINQKTIVRSRD